MAKRNQQVEGEEKVKFSREGYQKAKQISGAKTAQK